MMTFLALSFLASLLFGQLASFFTFGTHVYLHDFTLLVLLAAGGIYLWQKSSFIPPKLSRPIGLFVLVAALSILANFSRFSSGSSFFYLLRWLAYALLYVLVVQRLVSAKIWLAGLFLVGTGFSVLGLFQLTLYPSLRNLYYLGWDPYYYRLFSTLFDPNFAGLIIGLTILLGLYFLADKRRRTLVIFAQLVNAIALLLTFSRGSFLAVLSGLVIYGLIQRNWKPVVATFVVMVILVAAPKPAWEGFQINRSTSALARLNNWRESFSLFTKAPVLGYGFANLPLISPPKLESAAPSRAGAGIDSSLFFILDTTGLVGLVAFGWLTLTVIKLGKKVAEQKRTKTLGAVFLSTLVVLGVHSLFSNSLFYPWVMVWMWTLTGVIESPKSPYSS